MRGWEKLLPSWCCESDIKQNAPSRCCGSTIKQNAGKIAKNHSVWDSRRTGPNDDELEEEPVSRDSPEAEWQLAKSDHQLKSEGLDQLMTLTGH